MIYATKECDWCGKKVEIRHKERLSHKNCFCSKACEAAYRKAHNPNYIPCVICGQIIYVKPRNQNGENCCSLKCMGELRKSWVGEKNPNYGNRGSNNPIWKSDKRISSYGYVLVRKPDHPFCNCDGFVFEHRLVAEQYLLDDFNSIEIGGKRYLRKEYDVHHKDKNRKNNDPSNLEVLTKSQHIILHKRKSSKLAS